MGFNSAMKGLKFSYMFRFNNHHQGATIRTLLKLQSLKIISILTDYFYFDHMSVLRYKSGF